MKNRYFDNTNIKLTDEMIQKFDSYKIEIIQWNKIMDITKLTTDDDIYIKHFIDSLFFIKSGYSLKDKKLIDIGTGGGFPGIPLKIYEESLDVTLLDSLNKRVNFLNNVISSLHLKNVEAIHDRAENLAKKINYRENYDFATSRAVANLRILSELCLPFVKIGGYFVAMKGPKLDKELEEAKQTIEKLGGKIVNTINYHLPHGFGERNLLIIKKISSTPKIYPRSYGQIKNKTL